MQYWLSALYIYNIFHLYVYNSHAVHNFIITELRTAEIRFRGMLQKNVIHSMA